MSDLLGLIIAAAASSSSPVLEPAIEHNAISLSIPAVDGMRGVGASYERWLPSRRISLAAMRALGLDEVWWLVSPGNPLKSAKDMAPFEARLASARLRARRSRIVASDFEARAGTRYTIDTVAALRRRHPKLDFIWLMGGDTVAQFHHWKDWRKLVKSLPIAVIARPGYDHSARAARAYSRRAAPT